MLVDVKPPPPSQRREMILNLTLSMNNCLSSLLLSAIDISKLPQPPRSQWDFCGKTFGSSRALDNHEGHDQDQG